jgi:predicted DNA-binding WGR domain protein
VLGTLQSTSWKRRTEAEARSEEADRIKEKTRKGYVQLLHARDRVRSIKAALTPRRK